MYAIVDFKGMQFKAEKDKVVKVPFLSDAEVGAKMSLESVIFFKDENDVVLGTPTVSGTKVDIEVLAHKKDKKVIVFKKKRRKGYKRKQGHRQDFTEIKVNDIVRS